MKSIKALALTIVLGLTGLAYAAGQAQDKATNARQSTAASCCTAGADCCANGGSACCQAHHAKHDGTQHAAHAASNAATPGHEAKSCGGDSCCAGGGSSACCSGGGACCATHQRDGADTAAHGQQAGHGKMKDSCRKTAHQPSVGHDVAAHATVQVKTQGESCCAGGASCCDGSSSCCTEQAGAAKSTDN